jgi:hypothetical protein
MDHEQQYNQRRGLGKAHAPASSAGRRSLCHRPTLSSVCLSVSHRPTLSSVSLSVSHRPTLSSVCLSVSHRPTLSSVCLSVSHRPTLSSVCLLRIDSWCCRFFAGWVYVGRIRHLPQSAHVLQLGVGTSRLHVDMADDGYSLITSIDYSPVAIKRLQRQYPGYPGLHYAVADARSAENPTTVL